MLCHQPIDGGVARHLRDLIEGLQAKGAEIVLASPAIPQGAGQAVTHRSLDLRRAVAPRADLAALLHAASIVASVRPDVIHAHSSKAGAIARLARTFFPRTPVIYTPHGYAFAGFFARSGERRAYRGVERVLAPLASRVVCVCEAEARLASSIGPRARVRVIHNGIAPAREGPADPRIAELARRGPVIGALTLLRPGKGVETLIAAVPLLLAHHPDAQIAIVGDGPDLDELAALARTLGVAHAVHFLGASADPLAALRAMQIVVHASWAEAFPYVVLEAMSLAQPIVASDVGGISEAVIHGQTGLLTAARDERGLARALVELLDDPQRATGMGREGLRRVRAQFTLERMIDGVTGVYEEVVRPSRVGTRRDGSPAAGRGAVAPVAERRSGRPLRASRERR
jgi:glycosyltransferase involved in cell wall biosynthesis